MTVNLRPQPKAPGAARALVRRFIREKRLGVVGAVIVLLLLVFGIFSELLAPYGMDEKSLPTGSRRRRPSTCSAPTRSAGTF